MSDRPSQEEREFLSTLTEDRWPLAILQANLDETAFASLQAMAVSLVRQGLAGIYGRPDDARDVPLAEAEGIILDRKNWDPQEGDNHWMISTTEAGNALLGAPNEW